MHFEIPHYTKDALDRWAAQGILPGGFLQSVLRNDLMGACARADVENRAALFEITSYIYNVLPSQCWGSDDKIAAWIKRFESKETA